MGPFDWMMLGFTVVIIVVVVYVLYTSGGGGLLDGLGDAFSMGADVIGGVTGFVGGNQQLGEECEKGKLACGAGLVCDAGVCANAFAEIGERCTAGQMSKSIVGMIGGGFSKKGGIECVDGARCVNNVCYKEPTEKGDKCYPDKLKCPSGLTCWPRSGWGTCYNDPVTTAGEFCVTTGSNKIKCGDGLTCYPRTSAGGKCHADPAPKGAFCIKSGGKNRIECQDPWKCKNNVCV